MSDNVKKYNLLLKSGVGLFIFIDKIYIMFKKSEMVKDLNRRIQIKDHNVNLDKLIVRSIEEKSIDNKILNNIKSCIKEEIDFKRNKDNKNFIQYIDNIMDRDNLVEKYNIYKVLIDKMGIRQKMNDDVYYNLSKEEIFKLIHEFNLRTNSDIIGVLNSLSK